MEKTFRKMSITATITNQLKIGADGKLSSNVVPINKLSLKKAGDYTIIINYGSNQTTTKFFFKGIK